MDQDMRQKGHLKTEEREKQLQREDQKEKENNVKAVQQGTNCPPDIFTRVAGPARHVAVSTIQALTSRNGIISLPGVEILCSDA